MRPQETHLVALDVLEGTWGAETVEAVVEAVRPDLEVLAREDLIRVVMAVAWEARAAVPVEVQARVLRRFGQKRLYVMVDGS